MLIMTRSSEISTSRVGNGENEVVGFNIGCSGDESPQC